MYYVQLPADAEVHVKFCLTLYEIQRRAGRYYLHEHPRTATSWKLRSVGRFEKYADTIYIDANMCQFGMVTSYKGEQGLVEKATTFMTNSMEIAARLDRQCTMAHKAEHKHLAIWGVRAREAQVYPPALCKAVAEGIKAQKMVDETNLCGLDLCELGISDDDLQGLLDLLHLRVLCEVHIIGRRLVLGDLVAQHGHGARVRIQLHAQLGHPSIESQQLLRLLLELLIQLCLPAKFCLRDESSELALCFGNACCDLRRDA